MNIVAEGWTAWICDCADGKIAKVKKPDRDYDPQAERANLLIVRQLGISAPEPAHVTTIEGNPALIMEKLEGPTMLSVLKTDLARHAELATIHSALQASTWLPCPELPMMQSQLQRNIARAELGGVWEQALLGRLELLSSGPLALCHFDFHADNVMLTNTGPVVIDWERACQGRPAADFARSLVVAGYPSGLQPGSEYFVDCLIRDTLARAPFDFAEVTPWLPVIAAARLAEGWGGETGRQYAEREELRILGAGVEG